MTDSAHALAAVTRDCDAADAVKIIDWILREAIRGSDEVAIVQGACERVCGAGIPLQRAAVASDLLDPSFDSQGVVWSRKKGATRETFMRDDDTGGDEEWMQSPFYPLVKGTDSMLRRRLDASYRRGEFPIVDEFQDRGGTDYVAMIERVGESMWVGETHGVVVSWLTDDPRGFADDAIEFLASILPGLATVFLWRTLQRTNRALLTTYLGTDAAQRVLAGNVVRGRAETIRAVVWYSDLVGFTRIADTTAPDIVLAMLNDYAEAQVEAIESHGGHVLKFIGDGLLAIFPDSLDTSACVRAIDAAAEGRKRIVELNARRQAAGLPISDTHVALHIGELLYGNVGSPRRLDFTVLGSAVNEAARIEALCGSLDQPVIVSNAFAEAAGEARSRLVSLGRYAMKGVARPQELYTLDL